MLENWRSMDWWERGFFCYFVLCISWMIGIWNEEEWATCCVAPVFIANAWLAGLLVVWEITLAFRDIVQDRMKFIREEEAKAKEKQNDSPA
jgi:hypothetical protein